MTKTEQLVEIEAIKQLKARYFRFMDVRDWDGLAATLAQDVDFDHPTIGRHHGAAAVMAALKQRLQSLVFTVHHGSMPEIVIQSATSASGIWSLHSCVMSAATPRPLQGYGRYFDTYERSANGWQIKSLRLVHLYKES